MTKTSPSKRRGRPPGTKNKTKIVLTHTEENMSPWLKEIADLNQEINSLREKLAKSETIIDYLESKITSILVDL
jgi:hypothetical protein